MQDVGGVCRLSEGWAGSLWVLDVKLNVKQADRQVGRQAGGANGK